MTREEILDKRSNLVLDMLVADVVMGWEPHRRNTSIYVPKGKANEVLDYGSPRISEFRPSSSWEGIRIVVEKMREHGKRFELYQKADGTYRAKFIKGAFTSVKPVYADTAPEAACKAAILAVLGL